MPVHPGPAGVAQDRPGGSPGDRAVNGPPDRGRQRDEHKVVTLANYAQDAVTVFLADVADVRAGGFEDPQPQQAQHHHQRKVTVVVGLASGGE
jgi:hypothetical protein